MTWILTGFRTINGVIARAAMTLAIIIMAIIVAALSASAATRYISGTGYDWLIELPPILVPWLVFPLLGPLLRSGHHIQVDILPTLIGPKAGLILRLLCNLVALGASIIFLIAGSEAVALFKMLGQTVELEIEFPIWTMYLAFPVGFAILAAFALELILETVAELSGRPAEDRTRA